MAAKVGYFFATRLSTAVRIRRTGASGEVDSIPLPERWATLNGAAKEQEHASARRIPRNPA
jgi:hypothetical protein